MIARKAKTRQSRELQDAAKRLGSTDFRVSSGGNWYLVVSSEALGCKASIQYRRRDGEFVAFWPFAEKGEFVKRQERRAVKTADDVVALVRGVVTDAEEDPILWHGTSRSNLESILREGVQGPSYWGAKHTAQEYADSRSDGVLIGIRASRFPDGSLAINAGVVKEMLESDPEFAADWETSAKDWRASLRLTDSVCCEERLRIDADDVEDVPTSGLTSSLR